MSSLNIRVCAYFLVYSVFHIHYWPLLDLPIPCHIHQDHGCQSNGGTQPYMPYQQSLEKVNIDKCDISYYNIQLISPKKLKGSMSMAV